MASTTDRLYLIGVKYHIVAIIPAKDPLEAINKYLTRIGFANIRAYFCSRLMVTTTTISASSTYKNHFIVVGAKTIGYDHLTISSENVTRYDDIFDQVGIKDINSPMFVRPAVEEARNCVGFSRVPMYRLRKFCI